MPTLSSDQRKTLETTIIKARELAERGARDALTALAVGAAEPYSSMGDEERRLRNRLRAHGRQLGDQRDAQKGTQTIERLVREMAYEHWHRMLFARFLAENRLLIEPTSRVAITLEECEELAAEEGTDLWELAAQFAQAMLPQIFRVDDPVLAVKLPREIRQQLQGLVAGLEPEVFTASDSLGWTYQFWQTAAKEAVNKSGNKIGADEISPVTQLFTEPYMVDFLLDNTLGAWHAGKALAANPQLAVTAQSEEDLRQAVSLPGCPWAYLRFIRSEEGSWSPAAGTFEGWPKTAAELKCLDPCMGSGHFVVAMFDRLVALRGVEEPLTEAEAVAAVLRSNLFGLEIDPRCTQIAAFNLALAAWRRVGYSPLPSLNLACSGLAPNTSRADWLALAGDNERLRNGMDRLYRLFEQAAVLGSLINPRNSESDLLVAGFAEIQPLLEKALIQEAKDVTTQELAVTARGLAKAAEILAGQFTLVATNVPYLGRRNQCEVMTDFSERYAKDARHDLAAVFLQRSLDFCSKAGVVSLVEPQNWLFLGAYKEFRKRVLQTVDWQFVSRLGAGAFEAIGGEVVNVVLICMGKRIPGPKSRICGWDVSSVALPVEKALAIRTSETYVTLQSEQIENPDHRIILAERSKLPLLSDYAFAAQGLMPADRARLVRLFWENPDLPQGWHFMQGSIDDTSLVSGRRQIFAFQTFAKHINSIGGRLQGMKAWSRFGVGVSPMNRLPVTIYTGEPFDENVHAIIPNNPQDLNAIWSFCSSSDYTREVRRLDQKLGVTCSTLVKVPFDIEYWRKISIEEYPDGLPRLFSFDPTQWLFDGSPVGSDSPLHVAVARLVGYQWPRQAGSSFPDCPALEPDGLESLTDDDGIVCLASVRGEASAAERLRKLLAAAFKDDWSSAKERELLLAAAVDHKAKKPEPDLESWLRSSFFAEHCKLFQSRPFVWQIWDGNPRGFSALVNYHKLAAPNGQGRRTLELLTYTYLGDWIDRQKLELAEGVDGADDRLAAALDLQEQLKKILEGEPPYDIFVRWKPLHQQPIGWDPDINDGVRLNIRPFLTAQLRKGGKAGAGILRAKPGTIKWAKDRGKEPMRAREDFPWFWGWDESDQSQAIDFGAPIPGAPPAGEQFDGNRWNDLHYTRAAKEAARARQQGGH